LKILFITPRFFPDIGGVEKHTQYVAKKLAEHGNNITIITSTEREDIKTYELMDGIKVYRKVLTTRQGPLVRITKMFFFLLEHFRELRSNDIIHLHDYLTFLWCLPLLLFMKRPIFITFHGYEKYPVPKLSRTIRNFAEKFLNGNICIGQFIVNWYGTKPDFVIIGGVEPPVIPTNNSTGAALFIGRLAQDTGISDFLESLLILKRKYGIELPLQICGDGPLAPDIKRYSEQNGLKVFMNGFVEDIVSHILKCDYVFATGYLSILDAMSCKRPVFANYNNPLKKDYLFSIPNSNDLMFIAGSPDEMVDKLFRAITHPEVVKLTTERAYSFAKDQSWANVANIYLKLYWGKA
jgi:glycosyltransferase involved in cell wall biosynthesis